MICAGSNAVAGLTESAANEAITTGAEELMNFLTEKGHPVLDPKPLM